MCLSSIEINLVQMETEGRGAVSVSQSVARQGCGFWTAPSLATPICALSKFQGDGTLPFFSSLQAAAGKLLHRHLQLNQAAWEWCVVKLTGNVSVGPVGWFSMAWGAESLLLGLAWCFTPGTYCSCDLCFALSAHPTLLVPQVCAQVSTSFMQDMDVPGQGAGLTKGADFIAADTS